MVKSNIFFIFIFIFIQAVFSNLTPVYALPVFARKYKTSCTTCHLAIPKRTAFGEAFRKNGYRIPNDDAYFVKEKPVKLGAEARKRMFPDSIWPGSLPETVPIAFYVHMRADWSEGEVGKKQPNFDAPHEIELILGGTWGENISFFGEWLVFEKNKVDEARLGHMFVQFNDVFKEDIFNIRIGRFEVDSTYGFKDDNRMTLSHFNTFDYKVDGTFNLRSKKSGIGVNGILMDRLEYAVGIVNGNGSTQDSNNAKDSFYRVAYKLGGMSLTGDYNQGDSLTTTNNWRDDSIQIGQFGYFGDDGHIFSRIGMDARIPFSRFEFGSAVVLGKDYNLDGDKKDYDSLAYFIEGQARIFPWMFMVFRYESENIEKGSVKVSSPVRVIANLTMLQRANLRWSLELVQHPDKNDGNNSVKVNLMIAF